MVMEPLKELELLRKENEALRARLEKYELGANFNVCVVCKEPINPITTNMMCALCFSENV